MSKKVLIVVDFQIDFVTGSLGFPSAKDLDSKIAARIEEARENDEDVIFTFDTHQDNYLETKEGKDIPVPHCIKGSKGIELYGQTALAFNKFSDNVFHKNTFGSLDLANYLVVSEYNEIELCGLVSHMCVLSNAILAKSSLPDAKISVNFNLSKSFDDNLNTLAQNILKSLYINVIL